MSEHSQHPQYDGAVPLGTERTETAPINASGTATAPPLTPPPTPPLTPPPAFTRWPADGVVRYLLVGHVDATAAFSLYRRALDDLLANERRFVLDFADAAYVDGKALEQFKKLSQRIVEVRGSLVFDHVHDDLATLLELTGFNRVFEIRRSSAR